MTYLIIDPQTYLLNDRYKTFSTVSGAKRSLSAKVKKAQRNYDHYVARFGSDGWLNQADRDLEIILRSVVISYEEFDKNEPMAIRKNLMTGETYSERLNTPISCSPSSETYWSM